MNKKLKNTLQTYDVYGGEYDTYDTRHQEYDTYDTSHQVYDEYDTSHQIYDVYCSFGDGQAMNTEQEYAQARVEHLAASGHEYDTTREVLEVDQELE